MLASTSRIVNFMPTVSEAPSVIVMPRPSQRVFASGDIFFVVGGVLVNQELTKAASRNSRLS